MVSPYYTPIHGRDIRAHRGAKGTNLYQPMTRAKNDENTDGTTESEARGLNSPESSGEQTSLITSHNKNAPSSLTKAIRALFYGSAEVISFAFIFLGLFSMCGLILNVLGYGYQLTLQDGLVIDTIENMRLKFQFQREIIRSMQEATQQVIPVESQF